jgi:phospholipid transport system substrate-binding protein
MTLVSSESSLGLLIGLLINLAALSACPVKETMNIFKKFCAAATLALGTFAFIQPAQAQEAPDALVKRISQEVIDTAKTDKDIQSGNQKKVIGLVEEKILPHVDFQRMTALAAGRFWRDASPEQQKQLTNEFRTLLVYTYSGAISQVRDQKLEFRPMRAEPGDTEVEVRSQVLQPRGGDPIQINYRLEKLPNGSWKIFDVNVLGAWLVETYKGNFASEISKGGVDGLIKTLSDKNKRLAASAAKPAKSAS